MEGLCAGSPPSRSPRSEQPRQPHSRRELNQTGQWKIPLWSLLGRDVAAAVDQGLLGTWLSGLVLNPPPPRPLPAEPPSGGGGGCAQKPCSPSTGPWACLVKVSFSIRAGFPDLGARGSAFLLPLVEQEDRRQSFLPPNLQPRCLFDTQITLESEAQLWLCPCGGGWGASCLGVARRGGVGSGCAQPHTWPAEASPCAPWSGSLCPA